MQDVNRNTREFDNLGLRELARPRRFVDVAADGCEWSDCFQLIENRRIAYIASVNDVIGATQRLNGLGPQQTVGVGDDADEGRGSQLSVLSSQFPVVDSSAHSFPRAMVRLPCF